MSAGHNHGSASSDDVEKVGVDPEPAELSKKPPRQEQLDADPTVTEVGPGVLRMQLPIDLPGLGHVNCYALIDDRGLTLVDPGVADDESWSALKDRLAQGGFTVADVHSVLVTHSHFDHFGGAYRLQAEFGADVITHDDFEVEGPRSTEELMGDDLSVEDAMDLIRERMNRDFPWGTKRDEPTEDWLRMVAIRRQQWASIPTPTQRVGDSALVKMAGREWFSLFTPGHTADHLCLFDPETGLLLSGDHVLPTITPHISGMLENTDPLDDFFASLDRVRELAGVTLALPAHGHPFANVGERAADIKSHHAERLSKLTEIADAIGLAPVEAYSKELFSKRAWGEMAQSETFAHLEHLRKNAKIRREINEDGEFFYQAN